MSSVSSDATPASQLDADVDFSVTGPTTLTITLTNPAGGDALFNINQLYFNGSTNVTGLSLVSATHSVAGDVTAAWVPVELAQGADGFGTFDFALTDGVGSMNPAIVEPGEDVVFVLTISGTGPFVDADFIVNNAAGFNAAAKFVNGPDDPESPGDEDSAFGAVPEPGTLGLMGLGLAGLLAATRRHRGARLG